MLLSPQLGPGFSDVVDTCIVGVNGDWLEPAQPQSTDGIPAGGGGRLKYSFPLLFLCADWQKLTAVHSTSGDS